jgi:nucleoid-associated protein YejK
MNADDEVYITEDVLKELKEAYKDKYYRYFCNDGFFWGQQFQEEAVNEYKGQDKKFIEWCEEAIKRKQTIVYTCSW